MNLRLIPGILPDKLILKCINKRVGTDLQRMILCLTALKRLAVHKPFIVNHDRVFCLHRPVRDGHHSRIVIPLFLNLFIDFFLCHDSVRLRHFHAAVPAERHFRPNCHLRGKNKRLARFDLFHGNRRSGHNVHAALIRRRRITVLNQGVRSLLVKDLRSVHFLDHASRHFSFPEPRDTDSPSLFDISSLDCFLHVFGRDFNCELCHVLFQIFYLYTHSNCFPP